MGVLRLLFPAEPQITPTLGFERNSAQITPKARAGEGDQARFSFGAVASSVVHHGEKFPTIFKTKMECVRFASPV